VAAAAATNRSSTPCNSNKLGWTTSTRTMSLSTAHTHTQRHSGPLRGPHTRHESSLTLPGGPQLARTACSARPTRAPWAAFTLGRSTAVRLETDGSCSLGPSTGFLNAFPHPGSGIASNIGKDGRAKRVVISAVDGDRACVCCGGRGLVEVEVEEGSSSSS
jgi:hypothetical protein